MKTLYFDCFSGISGDMIIGALIDAGADPKILEEELTKLNFTDEYTLKWKKIVKNGITSTKFDVVLTHDDHAHEHDHNHAHDITMNMITVTLTITGIIISIIMSMITTTDLIMNMTITTVTITTIIMITVTITVLIVILSR